MIPLTNRLSRLKPSLFKINYSLAYTSFVQNHIARDSSHPLNITQRRIRNEQRQEGLWWHATTGVDISKSSCVRHWARRRLMQAFVDELRERGYDENGKMVNVEKLQDVYVKRVVNGGRNVDLTGTLRMHGVPSLVPAKYEQVKEEVCMIVEALVQGAVDNALEMRGPETSHRGHRSDGLEMRRTQGQRSQNHRPQAVAVNGAAFQKMAAAKEKPSRIKPTASPELPFRIRGTSPAPRIKPGALARDAPRMGKSHTMSLRQDLCI